MKIQCEKCSKTFANEENLEGHGKVHQKTRYKLNCPVCTITFSTKFNLLTHFSSKHSKDELPTSFEWTKVATKAKKNVPTCKICKKSFARNENLVSHLYSFHSFIPRQRLKCDYCPKTFGRPSDVKKLTRKFHKVSHCSFNLRKILVYSN